MKLNNNSKNKNQKIVMTTIKTIIVSMIIMITTKITRNNKKNKNINNIFKNTKTQLISNIYTKIFVLKTYQSYKYTNTRNIGNKTTRQ